LQSGGCFFTVKESKKKFGIKEVIQKDGGYIFAPARFVASSKRFATLIKEV